MGQGGAISGGGKGATSEKRKYEGEREKIGRIQLERRRYHSSKIRGTKR